MIKIFFIKYIITILLLFFVTPSFSQETNLLNKTFLIFLEKEFLSNQIITKKNSNENYVTILDINKSEYLVSFDLLNKNINQYWFLIPTLKIVNKVNNKTYAFRFYIDNGIYEGKFILHPFKIDYKKKIYK